VPVIAAVHRWTCHPGFARTLPFALYIGFLALDPLAHAWREIDGRWLYAVRISLVVATLSMLWSHYSEVNNGVLLSLKHWALSLTVGVVVVVVWIALDQPWAVVGAGPGFDPHQANGALDWSLVTIRILGAAAVVPLMEELFWRSLVMRWIERPAFLTLAPAAVGWRAVAMSSIVFGVEHSLWVAGILAGLAYAWLYRSSGNLWSPIIAHSTTNLLLGIWIVTTGNWHLW
jgi:uncharacterized protein